MFLESEAKAPKKVLEGPKSWSKTRKDDQPTADYIMSKKKIADEILKMLPKLESKT